tara:strand:+ start:667 stop:1209 length:543 start_codon:yes stop_codon:yes gene_type:complete
MNSNNFVKKYQIPNVISIARLLITLYLFIYVDYSYFNTYILIVTISLIGLSDSLDGFLARKYSAVTNIGTIIDPFVDRTVFILLIFWLKPLFVDIFFWGVIIRDLFVILGSLFVLKKDKTIRVSTLGKVTTVLLFITICLFVLTLSQDVYILALVFSYISLFLYYYVALEYLFKQILFSK